MTYTRYWTISTVAAAALLSLSCDDQPVTEPVPPVPGEALVVFDSPNADEGAVLLTVKGPSVPVLRSGSDGYAVFTKTLSDGSARAIIVGHLADGVLVTAGVDDLERLDEYEVTLDQVSSRDSELRTDLTGFSLTLERVPD